MFTKQTKSLTIGGLLLSLVLINPDPSLAETLSHIPGAFLDVGLGAGPMGLGGSVVVLGRDVYTIVGNPAGLISLSGPEAAFSMTKQFSFVPYNLVLYGQNLGKQTALGVGFLTSGDDALRENSVYLTVARKLPLNFCSVGLNLKFRQASFGNNSDGEWIYDGGNRQVKGSARGIGFDFGLRGKLGKGLGFGLVLKDILANISYDASNAVGTAKGGSESIPPTLLLGLGYVVNKNLIFELNLNKSLYQDTNDRLFFGVEKRVFSLLALRGGLSQNINAPEVNRHYALGLGLSPELKQMPLRFALDFAYLINEFQNFFHVGFKVGWGGK